MLKRFAFITSLIIFNTFLYSCAEPYYNGYYGMSPYGQQGAAVGGILGTTAGIMLDHSNPWRGALIGGMMGSLLGGSLGEISNQAAIQNQRPVQYYNMQVKPQPQCQKITDEYFENGYLIKTQTRIVCAN